MTDDMLATISDHTYEVVYADPPWKFKTRSIKGQGRSAEAHYDTMDLGDIKALPINRIADNPAVVYLWVTVPHLLNGLATLEAWGFEYKSNVVWVKDRIGTGYWTRNRHEHLLIGARGNGICPRFRDIKVVESVVNGQQRAHSQKPDAARAMIDHYHPNARKIELFARGYTEGWDSFGDQVDDGIAERRYPSNSYPGEGDTIDETRPPGSATY